ncbi:hypothetical protein ACLOJK_039221, partial [Asimina triloba]
TADDACWILKGVGQIRHEALGGLEFSLMVVAYLLSTMGWPDWWATTCCSRCRTVDPCCARLARIVSPSLLTAI